MIQPGRRPTRIQETPEAAQPTSQPVGFPAPVGGWAENQSLATGNTRTARVLENMFPTLQGVRVRGGRQKAATIGARVRSMFTYQTGTTTKLFAATSNAVYDISALDPNVVPTPSISSLANGYWIAEQMGTVAGEYLVIVNGQNSLRLFNGSTWTTINGASTPAITGVTTSDLKYVWKHKNRLWFIKKDSQVAYYLPVDSVGGTAAEVSLAGVFQVGGKLLFGATWSQDAGDGSDDRMVFVSDEGEVAVFAGSNPADSTDWDIVGLYRISRPMGPKAHMRAGGDLVIATESGIVSMTAVVNKDPAAMDVAQVTTAIEPAWRYQVLRDDNVQPWELLKWPRENMLLVTLPHDLKTCFVSNLQTGAWSKYIGWDVQCGAIFNQQLYFGDRDGSIFAAEVSGADDGQSYVARVSLMPSDLGSPVSFKAISLMKGTFLSATAVQAQLSVSSDYQLVWPSLPPTTAEDENPGALWGVGLWGVAKWGDSAISRNQQRPAYSTGWKSVGARGKAVAPQMQMVVSGSARPSTELVSLDLLMDPGGMVD